MRLVMEDDAGYVLVTLSLEDKMESEISRFLNDNELFHVQVRLPLLPWSLSFTD